MSTCLLLWLHSCSCTQCCKSDTAGCLWMPWQQQLVHRKKRCCSLCVGKRGHEQKVTYDEWYATTHFGFRGQRGSWNTLISDVWVSDRTSLCWRQWHLPLECVHFKHHLSSSATFRTGCSLHVSIIRCFCERRPHSETDFISSESSAANEQ